MRTTVLRVVALSLLLLLTLVGVIAVRTLRGVPNAVVYFVKPSASGGSFTLEGVTRRSGGGTPEQLAAQQVAALAAGPTSAEQQRGLRSAVPPTTALLGAELVAGLLRVDVSAPPQQARLI